MISAIIYISMKKTSKGFTVLETVLVLAIAGLILIAVFIAIPNLARSQRDTDRRGIFSKILSATSQYQASNRKALPSIDGKNPDGTNIYQIFLKYNDTKERYENVSNGATTEWPNLFATYFDEKIKDPNGEVYKISVTACDSGAATNSPCMLTYYDGVNTTNNLNHFYEAHFPNDYIVLIVINAKCGGGSENLLTQPGENKVALLFKLENGGTYCENN